MTFELSAKIISDGLFFTPNALIRDAGGVMTIFIYFVFFNYFLYMYIYIFFFECKILKM